MLGLMQDGPLLISGLLDYAERYHPRAEIVSRDADGGEHRYGYAEAAARARRLASALQIAGIRPGDRVATLAMNHHRHFELYFGVSGMGAVLHTVNPRLFAPQIDYIVNHGGSRILFVDPAFVSLVGPLAPALRSVGRYVVLGGPEALDEAARALPNVVDYESSWRPAATARHGRCSTNAPHRRSATRRARRAIPRACFIRIARRCCTRSRPANRARSISRRIASCSPSRRCSTPMPGASPISRP
ncbi:hypothetical protein RSO01_63540 [Reyranella soli]|uniref:AMP-dependent synthetase/ligase domain-containing protein n=1 Tax=Reyranella soli TaxID=1230389 RepID=A0A512NJQ3_9HYPH|nr:hypothetical protein RSO01_63540 [Reyranella soli]